MGRFTLLALFTCGLIASASHAGPVAGIGALGDSFTDEYQFYPPDRSHARNFVEILSATRHLNFGPFTTASRGEPRDAGFAYNWARSDATSSDMVSTQLRGLSRQVSSSDVNLAWVFAGGNDYLDLYSGGLQNPVTAADVTRVTNQLGINIRTSVDTLLAASPNARVVVGTVPDLRLLPIVRAIEHLFPPIVPLVQDASQAIAALDGRIAAEAAANPRIALVDVNALLKNLASTPTITVGSLKIDTTTPGDSPDHLFLKDGLHAGTVGQAFLANQFINAVDAKFSAGIPPLSDGEIAAYAESIGGTPTAVPLPGAVNAAVACLPFLCWMLLIRPRRSERVDIFSKATALAVTDGLLPASRRLKLPRIFGQELPRSWRFWCCVLLLVTAPLIWAGSFGNRICLQYATPLTATERQNVYAFGLLHGDIVLTGMWNQNYSLELEKSEPNVGVAISVCDYWYYELEDQMDRQASVSPIVLISVSGSRGKLRAVAVSYWFLMVLPAIYAVLRWRSERRDNFRRKYGLCLYCGYDLRASRDVCPECGILNADRSAASPGGERGCRVFTVSWVDAAHPSSSAQGNLE